MPDLASAMYPNGPSTVLGNQIAQEGKAAPSQEWWLDKNLDWNTVKPGQHYDFSDKLPADMWDKAHRKLRENPDDFPGAYKESTEAIENLIQKHKLKPGDLFTTKEPRGPKTYMYMGPGHPIGQNFFLYTPPQPGPEVA